MDKLYVAYDVAHVSCHQATPVPQPVLVKEPPASQQVETTPEPVSFELTTTEVPALHAQFDKWVIFSDLHVKGSSIDACEEVLAEVHAAAVRHNAGIIFLGDFWHVRGSLSVELLNRVLKALRLWQQPVIMIPGNHDQVDLNTNL